MRGNCCRKTNIGSYS